MTLQPKAQLYVMAVTAAGMVALFDCVREIVGRPNGSDWLVLAALTLLSGSFTIKVPRLPARISVSETFVFASVLLFGTCAATITVALDTLVASVRVPRAIRQPIRIVFNLSAAVTSIWISSQLFYILAAIPPLSDQPVRLPQIFLPLIALSATYFLLNSAFVAGALALERQTNAYTLWRSNFLWLSLNYFGGASAAALLVSYTQTVDFTALIIIVPLILISYLTYKTSLGRIDDANRHVEEVDSLYISTIETLATAIDAKDQVTHGHIRRVQRYTLALAKQLGVTDDLQLKALEAAALLHDTGKLVVPEHILNKPGKLTPGEFERMKLHAGAGADILSAIRFPYPVVPIVRHHHENWDGTGYPDKLKGTDIPIGARILAVVDCFDALTSDRPYRGRLSDEKALAILMQRRGSMYDPLVVDTFAAVRERLEAELTGLESLPVRISNSRSSNTPSQEQAAVLPTSSDSDSTYAVQTVLKSIMQATDATTAVLYLRDSNKDEAFAAAALGPLKDALEQIRMPLGTGISGWVIANGRAIINSDGALDLCRQITVGDENRCASVPIIFEGEAIGALASYIDRPNGFDDRDVQFLEYIAAKFAQEPLHGLMSKLLQRHSRSSSSSAIH